MSIPAILSMSKKFENFCLNIRINEDSTKKISARYKAITKRLNIDFYNTESEINHSLYVGSYGRDTDIHVSDIDVIFQMPYAVYKQYNSYIWNWQSALLQAVKTSIQNRYNTTESHWDWQVVGVDFTDGIKFEIVPVFLLKDNKWYYYPDTHNQGSWKTTNPKPEIEEIRNKNMEWNSNLKRLCRMIRAWKEKCDVPLWGLLIDTFSSNFLENWEYKDKSYVYYDWMIRDFFLYLSNLNEDQEYWLAPGSNQRINRKGKFKYKAKQAYNLAREAIWYENENMPNCANWKWKDIFGSKFTW